VPDFVDTPSGIKFKPFLGAATSHDSSLATTYKRGVTCWVCDNTLAAGLAESGGHVRIKHIRNSNLRISSARQALGILEQTVDEFTASVERLVATTVTDAQWSKVLDKLVPVPNDEGRAKSLAETKRAAISRLYNTDVRAATRGRFRGAGCPRSRLVAGWASGNGAWCPSWCQAAPQYHPTRRHLAIRQDHHHGGVLERARRVHPERATPAQAVPARAL